MANVTDALLTFMQTITYVFFFAFLCPPTQMDDGKSIRYKDLYALFEHILEKTMRLEQRDWSESPVKVWVNTFKVFLDEFMTEYKPMEGTISRVRCKKNRWMDEKKTGKYFRMHLDFIDAQIQGFIFIWWDLNIIYLLEL